MACVVGPPELEYAHAATRDAQRERRWRWLRIRMMAALWWPGWGQRTRGLLLHVKRCVLHAGQLTLR